MGLDCNFTDLSRLVENPLLRSKKPNRKIQTKKMKKPKIKLPLLRNRKKYNPSKTKFLTVPLK